MKHQEDRNFLLGKKSGLMAQPVVAQANKQLPAVRSPPPPAQIYHRISTPSQFRKQDDDGGWRAETISTDK